MEEGVENGICICKTMSTFDQKETTRNCTPETFHPPMAHRKIDIYV